MSKFSNWEAENPHFKCSECGKENTVPEGEPLGFCSCGCKYWNRYKKGVEE